MSSPPRTKLSGPQLRAARALLGISAQELATITGLGVATLRRAELLPGPVKMTFVNEDRIVRALEEAGVELIPENGGGPGVRFLKGR
jgi:predicted transcriptional regulator